MVQAGPACWFNTLIATTAMAVDDRRLRAGGWIPDQRPVNSKLMQLPRRHGAERPSLRPTHVAMSRRPARVAPAAVI